MDARKPSQGSGFALAIGAYLIWGMLPAYMFLLLAMPPMEFLGWRVLFTVPVCLLLVFLTGQRTVLAMALRSRRLLAALLMSACLIGANWVVFILAVTHGHVYAASLGYYMIPLVNIVIGTLWLRESLSLRQWCAVALATGGVLILFTGALKTLWISAALSATFSLYGLVRKLAPVDSICGLTIETGLLALPSALYLIYLKQSHGPIMFGQDFDLTMLVALSGIVTAAPLIMFTAAARMLPYSSIAFIQFLSPSLIFVQGLLLYREPLHPAQISSFTLIWVAIALFCWDILARRQKADLAD